MPWIVNQPRRPRPRGLGAMGEFFGGLGSWVIDQPWGLSPSIIPGQPRPYGPDVLPNPMPPRAQQPRWLNVSDRVLPKTPWPRILPASGPGAAVFRTPVTDPGFTVVDEPGNWSGAGTIGGYGYIPMGVARPPVQLLAPQYRGYGCPTRCAPGMAGFGQATRTATYRGVTLGTDMTAEQAAPILKDMTSAIQQLQASTNRLEAALARIRWIYENTPGPWVESGRSRNESAGDVFEAAYRNELATLATNRALLAELRGALTNAAQQAGLDPATALSDAGISGWGEFIVGGVLAIGGVILAFTTAPAWVAGAAIVGGILIFTAPMALQAIDALTGSARAQRDRALEGLAKVRAMVTQLAAEGHLTSAGAQQLYGVIDREVQAVHATGPSGWGALGGWLIAAAVVGGLVWLGTRKPVRRAVAWVGQRRPPSRRRLFGRARRRALRIGGRQWIVR